MPESHVIIHLLLTAVQVLTGVFANGIIVLVTGTDLIRGCRVLPLDLLLCCVAISRIGLQAVLFYLNLAVLSLIEFIPLPEEFVLFMFVSEVGLWFATWLSVFYCAKIAHIAHPLFFWLKLRISRLVPWLILGSLLYTSLMSVFHRKYTWILYQKVWSSFLSSNATTQVHEIPALQLSFLVTELLLPLLIFLVSALLLLFSLGRHTQQMRSTATGSGPPNTRVHRSVLLSILSFLVLYVSQYLLGILIMFQNFKERNLAFLFAVLVADLYPCGHSIILILGNPKLKQNAKKCLLHSKCCQ